MRVNGIEHKFSPDDKVQVLVEGKWLDAILVKYSPYVRINRPGYEFQYDPLPKTDPVTWITPSRGGWISENCVRPRI